jgi:hypothetical protein
MSTDLAGHVHKDAVHVRPLVLDHLGLQDLARLDAEDPGIQAEIAVPVGKRARDGVSGAHELPDPGCRGRVHAVGLAQVELRQDPRHLVPLDDPEARVLLELGQEHLLEPDGERLEIL